MLPPGDRVFVVENPAARGIAYAPAQTQVNAQPVNEFRCAVRICETDRNRLCRSSASRLYRGALTLRDTPHDPPLLDRAPSTA
jgi:hypothetical protein